MNLPGISPTVKQAALPRRHYVLANRDIPRVKEASVQIRPLQSIVLSCQRVPDTLQPSEFLGEFVQAYGWARLPVTPLNLFQVSCGELF